MLGVSALGQEYASAISAIVEAAADVTEADRVVLTNGKQLVVAQPGSHLLVVAAPVPWRPDETHCIMLRAVEVLSGELSHASDEAFVQKRFSIQ